MIRVEFKAVVQWCLKSNRLRLGWSRLCLVSLLAIAAVPRSAHAHLVTSGGGPFFDGLIHFYVSPNDFLTVVALALFSGLAGKRAARGLVLTLPVAWLMGAIVGVQFGNYSEFGIRLTEVSMLLTGLLLGTNPKLPKRLLIFMISIVGAWHGLSNGLAIAATGTSGLAVIGNVVAASLLALLLSATAASLSKPWQLVAVRVVGSWVAAIGLLALAWNFRPGS